MSAQAEIQARNERYEREYERVAGPLRELAGQRVRLTFPNGVQRAGEIELRTIGAHDRIPFMDGTMCGGEISTAILIEAMGSNGRYYEYARCGS